MWCYAVSNGKHPGIYYSWKELKERNGGSANLVYKRCCDIKEARSFIMNKYCKSEIANLNLCHLCQVNIDIQPKNPILKCERLECCVCFHKICYENYYRTVINSDVTDLRVLCYQCLSIQKNPTLANIEIIDLKKSKTRSRLQSEINTKWTQTNNLPRNTLEANGVYGKANSNDLVIKQSINKDAQSLNYDNTCNKKKLNKILIELNELRTKLSNLEMMIGDINNQKKSDYCIDHSITANGSNIILPVPKSTLHDETQIQDDQKFPITYLGDGQQQFTSDLELPRPVYNSVIKHTDPDLRHGENYNRDIKSKIFINSKYKKYNRHIQNDIKNWLIKNLDKDITMKTVINKFKVVIIGRDIVCYPCTSRFSNFKAYYLEATYNEIVEMENAKLFKKGVYFEPFFGTYNPSDIMKTKLAEINLHENINNTQIDLFNANDQNVSVIKIALDMQVVQNTGHFENSDLPIKMDNMVDQASEYRLTGKDLLYLFEHKIDLGFIQCMDYSKNSNLQNNLDRVGCQTFENNLDELVVFNSNGVGSILEDCSTITMLGRCFEQLVIPAVFQINENRLDCSSSLTCGEYSITSSGLTLFKFMKNNDSIICMTSITIEDIDLRMKVLMDSLIPSLILRLSNKELTYKGPLTYSINKGRTNEYEEKNTNELNHINVIYDNSSITTNILDIETMTILNTVSSKVKLEPIKVEFRNIDKLSGYGRKLKKPSYYGDYITEDNR